MFYEGFILSSDNDLDEYLQHGVFASNFGDLVLVACSNLLEIPILLISSSHDMAAQVFFPTSQITYKPIIIGFNSYEMHYSNTIPIALTDADEEGAKKSKFVFNSYFYLACLGPGRYSDQVDIPTARYSNSLIFQQYKIYLLEHFVFWQVCTKFSLSYYGKYLIIICHC